MMLWSRHCWSHGYECAASWQADSSTQNHHDYFCQRVDSLTIPPGIVAAQKLQVNLPQSFTRTLLPLGVLGYGESTMIRKMRVLLHVA
eukprot:4044634-Heterocapsa_arctica.AAC.1